MIFNRRNFIQQITFASGSIYALSSQLNGLSSEAYWEKVKSYFPIAKSKWVHLNSGSAGSMPQPVLDATINLMQEMNAEPAYMVWESWKVERERLKMRLAKLLGVEAAEIAIQRNCTEALNNIITSIPIKEDESILYSNKEYHAMINAIEAKARMGLFKTQKMKLPLPRSNDQIIEHFNKHIRPDTRYILISHMSFNNGRILPIEQIQKLISDKDIDLILDAAHSFGQFSFNLNQMGIQYAGTSLHKWLCAPHGTGLLYINKTKIKDVEPSLLFNAPKDQTSIEKFEQVGTHAFYTELGIQHALDFQEMIGFEKKEKRLKALVNYLIDNLISIKGIQNLTSKNADERAAIVTIKVDGIASGTIVKILKRQYNIIVKATRIDNGTGIRISPNLFTLYADLDYFVNSLKKTIHSLR